MQAAGCESTADRPRASNSRWLAQDHAQVSGGAMPSLFRSRPRAKPKAEAKDSVPAATVFRDDPDLLQLHAETAELLRLVKSPPAAKVRRAAAGSPATPRKRRVTIEVLDVGDDGDDDGAPSTTAAPPSAASTRRAQGKPTADPFAFDAEQARVRQGTDTFCPDTSPTKRAMAVQRDALRNERDRLDAIASDEQQRNARRNATLAKGFQVENRLDTSAVKIQARYRGFLTRKKRPRPQRKVTINEADASTAHELDSSPAADQWHEVRDVDKGEVWYYNALTGQSQWERPADLPRVSESLSLPDLRTRRDSNGPEMNGHSSAMASGSSLSNSLPPLSPSSSSACSSARSDAETQLRAHLSGGLSTKLTGPKTIASLPALRPDYATMSQNVWECDSVATSARSTALPTDGDGSRWNVDGDDVTPNDDDEAGDWNVNDSLFRADGSRNNSKLRDTIRQALQVSKFDSVSSLLASNVVLRKKPARGSPTRSPARGNQSTGKREIVLGKRDAPMLVAVLADSNQQQPKSTPKSTAKAKSKRSGGSSANPLACPPRIRDLTDPGFEGEDDPPVNQSELRSSTPTDPPASPSGQAGKQQMCFNCWSSSAGSQCDLHRDPRAATHKVASGASALLCSNWELDQLRRKYRAEEIQEVFMTQRASLRYDKVRKTYVTVVECRHPIYRCNQDLVTAWNKRVRRKLHTRSWFRSFIEHLRAGSVPRADSSAPLLLRLKNTLQNARWCSTYASTVREFQPAAPVTGKRYRVQAEPFLLDVIMIDPDRPHLRYWVLKTDCPRPVMLYRPRVYEMPPRRCVPMPTPSFLEDVPLPVPNVVIDCAHAASWFERLAARVATAAVAKAMLQIAACSPPRGTTDARRTKAARPVAVLFATFGRKPTHGNVAVGGLSAELLIHLLVTTYVPAQFGNLVVFERRAMAPAISADHDNDFACLVISADTPPYVFRALEHALNTRRPPAIVIATRFDSLEDESRGSLRFPANRPEQTGEELARGFRTFWLVDELAGREAETEGGRVVEPSAAVLAPNTPSLNATITTHVDRRYPFCVATTKENTPVEYLHLLWIGQSSRNQPQVFTSLGAQQPGAFMRGSDPTGALGACSSVIYRSWAYLQRDNPFDEFVTDDGVAYWFDKRTGQTFWTRPLLPAEQYRGKDGDVDGVIADGLGEHATLGVGAEEPRYAAQSVRKFITKRLEPPEDAERRRRLVADSARKLDITVDLGGDERIKQPVVVAKDLPRIQVPTLGPFKPAAAASPLQRVKETKIQPPKSVSNPQAQAENKPDVDNNTKQLIDSITQALGSALPSLGAASGAAGGVEMLQFGIGLGMGLGLRVQQQQQQQPATAFHASSAADSLESIAAEEEEDDDSALSTARSDASSVDTDRSFTARSSASVAISPSPDEVELLGGGASPSQPAKVGKTPGFRTHAPPGEGSTWVHKPVDASGASQTAVDGFGGALHQRVACLPKDFVAAVTSAKTCKMQANYLPVVKNMNQPRHVGIVRPRPALDEWLTVGYSPWSAGRAVFGTQFLDNLMQRPEIAQQQSTAAPTAQPAASANVTADKRNDNVSQAVRESQQLETIMSLCRHGKYDEVEVMLNSPDWTLPIDARDIMGNTLLSVACQNNNKRMVKLCLRRGADINTQNLNGQSVLHYCHEYGFHDLMEYLMDKGAQDDLVNSDGLTCYEGLNKEAVDAI